MTTITTTWLLFALWQSTLCLGVTLLLAQFGIKSPWRAHVLLCTGVFAAVFAPTLSTIIAVRNGMTASGIVADVLGIMLISGMLLFTLLLMFGVMMSRRLMFHARPFPDRESQEALLAGAKVLHELFGRTGTPGSKAAGVSLPILFTSDDVKSPTVWCWGLHPAVLLPEELAAQLPPVESEAAGFQAILLHELAHIARRDHLTSLFCRLSGTLLFWHPLYWLALWQSDLSADEACDLLVLSRGTTALFQSSGQAKNISPGDYADLLLKLAAGTRHRTAFQFLSRKDKMMKRIDTILDFADRPSSELSGERYDRSPRLWTAGVATLALLLCVGMAFCQEGMKTAVTDQDGQFTLDTGNPRSPVTGTVTMDGKPLAGATVTFSPSDDKVAMKAMTPEDVKAMWDELHPAMEFMKHFQGVGLALKIGVIEDGYVDVETVLKGGPADKSGEIHPQDRIIGIGQGKISDILDIKGLQFVDVMQLLRGPKGSVVRLEVLPGGKEPSKIVELVRDEIDLKQADTLWTNYPVNKSVADFKDGDVSTPEALYATYSKISASKDKEVIATLHDYYAKKIPPMSQRDIDWYLNWEDDWVEIIKTAEILMVYIYDNQTAFVIAKLDGENTQSPYDARWCKKVDGKWLNDGNERFDSPDKALAKFKRLFENEANKPVVTSLEKYLDIEGVKHYPVKKRIADFPADKIDLSTPEAAYATQKNLIVSDRKDKLEQILSITVGRPKIADVPEHERRMNDEVVSREWAKTYREEFVVLETFVLDDKYAFVFGYRAYDKLYDGNYFVKEGDAWLNNGNDQDGNAEDLAKRVHQMLSRRANALKVLEGLKTE